MTKRWFTDPAAHGPTQIRPDFTEIETATFVDILTFAKGSGLHRRELMHCVDAAGTIVHDTSTGHQRADHTPAMQIAMESRTGIRFWHNHPSQDSLSHSDWLCAGLNDDIEVLALNEQGSIFVGRIVDWDDRLTKLFEWLPRLAADLELHMDGLAHKLSLPANLKVELSHLTGHVLNRALATRMPIRYAYCFLGSDVAAIKRAGPRWR